MDKREDAGEYYPGGKVIPRRPVNPDPLEARVADVENRMTTAEEEIAGKQDTLTFDSVPAANSQNPVRSGGIWSAIWGTIATQYTSVARQGGQRRTEERRHADGRACLDGRQQNLVFRFVGDARA